MELIVGNHRLEACRLLGWKEIEANIVDLEALDRELAEIAENLMRNELTVLERSDHLARRKEIYETKHPETRHGGDRRSQSSRNDSDLKSFVQDTAEKTKVSESTIQQEVQISRKLQP